MSQVTQASRAVQFILDMLDPADQSAVIQRLNDTHGIRNDASRLYSDLEVAERYGVHVRTARNWIASGHLKGCQINSRWYSRADWMTVFEDQHALQGKGAPA